MENYTVIQNEIAADYLFNMMGNSSINFDSHLFTMMQAMLGEQYKHGLWELRQYSNGAIAYVFPSKDIVDFQGVEITLEAASLYANVMLFSCYCEQAYMANDESANERFHDLAHALRDAICGLMNFVVTETGIAEPTAEDLAKPRAAHHESFTIYKLLD